MFLFVIQKGKIAAKKTKRHGQDERYRDRLQLAIVFPRGYGSRTGFAVPVKVYPAARLNQHRQFSKKTPPRSKYFLSFITTTNKPVTKATVMKTATRSGLFLLLLLPLLLITATAFAQDLYTMPKGAQSHVSSFENLNGQKGAGGKTNNGAKGNAFEGLSARESKTLLQVNGAGIIQRMWFTIIDRSPAMLRSLRLRIYWDGQAKPAVDVPFGDFFCAALGRPVAFQSALFTDPEGHSFNCYIPMPFKTGAKVVLTNESGKNLSAVYFDIDYITLPQPQPDMLYFHACWNRSIHSTLGADFEMLPEVKGRGRFLGVNVGVNVDPNYGTTWWGEGEVKMYIDGDKKYPSINGTGTEDYIGTGWGEDKFTNQYQGCLLADTAKKQYAFYRFHIPDAIYFDHNFKADIQQIGGGLNNQVKGMQAKGVPFTPVTVASFNKGFIRLFEHPQDISDSSFPQGWINFYRVDDYSATAYFYLDKPTDNLKELAPVEERVK